MDEKIKAYLRLEAAVSGAFNFFINGMIAALIYHKADAVPVNAISVAADLAITCLLIFAAAALFCASSLRRTKAAGVFAPQSRLMGRLCRLFRRPLLFGAVSGIVCAAVLSALLSPLPALFGVKEIPFTLYIALKPALCALLGAGATVTSLYCGLHNSQ